LSGEKQRNVMEMSDFAGKPFPCPVCNTALPIKISLKQKPYCMCLDCGLQIFFRGQAGIRRLQQMISSEEAVAAEFDFPARAISIYNHLQHLKRQKRAFEDEQGIFSFDLDRQKVIDALDNEIARVRQTLEEASGNAEEEKMKPAVIYARVSSKEQEREGFSIPAQLKLLRDYAIRNDFSVVKEFVYVETAKTSGRQNFDQMVQFFTKNRRCRVVLVEKTDRLYRNFRDVVTLEDLDLEIHLVKEGQVISKDAKSQAKLIHGMQLVLARNYIENLREEVKKGMREKAEQGIYPGRAPLGYQNNRADRTIEVHPENAALVHRIFELYASRQYSLSQLKKVVRAEGGKSISRAYLHTILTNSFYVGSFLWGRNLYRGTHPCFIDVDLHELVQAVLRGHNKPKYRKQEFAFRGLLHCAQDHCAITAERKKQKYVITAAQGIAENVPPHVLRNPRCRKNWA